MIELYAKGNAENVIEAGGVPFKLTAPHTLESVRHDAERSERPESWRCRRGRHKREKIGTIYLPDDPFEATLTMIASTDTEGLYRCERCGCISVRGR